ncbi:MULTISPECIES: cytochrome P450 [unclassified Nocardiopsis]|uniref:cytochrome P450 n=1 Tax=unclassified Nocardiopsis TaxID=2649073 RepID=UPI00135B152E|nr:MULTISPECIES: cytochrome P450 [unclassified Nocardiopsis]
MPTQTEGRRAGHASETARVLASVLLPNVARGVILRRPLATGLAAGLDTDRAAAGVLHGLRERHGDDPFPISLAGRRAAVVLAPEDVERLLRETPEPFSPGGREKSGALSHFQPHGVLVSEHADRPRRRWANEAALVPGQAIHPDGDTLAAQADEEALALALALEGDLDWRRFSRSFNAMARRAVFGAFAARDYRTTELLRALRARANWAYLAPARRATRTEFLDRVRANVERAEPGSLAARLAEDAAEDADVRPEEQVAHWLFAFDAAAIAAFRALALLTSLSPGGHEVREEIEDREGLDLPLLRATVRESVRLWPTTLMIIREGTRETFWRERSFEAGTAFLVVSSYFHRDSTRLPYADAFEPGIWLDGRAAREPALVPFSGGPAECPAVDLVPLAVSLFLRSLVRGRRPARADAGGPLPASGLPRSLNHFALRFSL